MAVLPFDNLSGDPENEYFSEGITEEIIGQLAQVESLKVISRTSVMALKGSTLTLPQIAETLGVRHVVEGAVRRQGNRVRVTAELIEASSEAHLWSGSFEGNLSDRFRVQEEIARKVSEQLASGLRGVPAMPTGRDAVARARRSTRCCGAATCCNAVIRQSLDAAIRAFEDAVRLDGKYAIAYAGLSSANSTWVFYGYPGADRYALREEGPRAGRAVGDDRSRPGGGAPRAGRRAGPHGGPDRLRAGRGAASAPAQAE